MIGRRFRLRFDILHAAICQKLKPEAICKTSMSETTKNFNQIYNFNRVRSEHGPRVEKGLLVIDDFGKLGLLIDSNLNKRTRAPSQLSTKRQVSE